MCSALTTLGCTEGEPSVTRMSNLPPAPSRVWGENHEAQKSLDSSPFEMWVGEQFAAKDLAAYAIDLRGRGRSEGER